MAITATPRQAHPTKPLRPGCRYLPSLGPIRERRRWSQRYLAFEADVAPATIGLIECGGSAQLQTVHRLAKALGVSTQALQAVPEPRW